MTSTTILKALTQAKQSLSKHISGKLEAEILLAHALDKPRTHIIAWPDKIMSKAQANIFSEFINRRLNDEPIAYIIGEKEFWSLPINVTKDTLIPRPETERLIEVTLKRTRNLNSPCILDLGTGSGCIALALAKELPNAQITACDKSDKALAVAITNAQKLSLRNITFYLSDWFKGLPEQRFDVIVSNPPYIAPDDPHLSATEIQFEPQTALISGDDGLDDIRSISVNAKDYLSPSGILIFEIGHNQARSVLSILTQQQFQDITFHKDLLGHQRICSARNFTKS